MYKIVHSIDDNRIITVEGSNMVIEAQKYEKHAINFDEDDYLINFQGTQSHDKHNILCFTYLKFITAKGKCYELGDENENLRL
jgi:hypothetical protein